jgi:oxalate decarboxylase/phosphoglucose isomerase-like protein (cupin superfamily)
VIGIGVWDRYRATDAIPGGKSKHGQEAIVSEELAKKFRHRERTTPYLRWVRAKVLDIISAHYVRTSRTGRAQALGARGGRGVYINHERLAHLERLLRLRDPARQEARAPAPAVREMILVLDGRGSTTVWNDEGSASPSSGRRARCSPSRSMLAPALQRLRPGAGALRRGHQRAAGDQSLRGHRLRLQHQARLQDRFTASPTISAPRASRRACCCRPTFVADAVNLPLISAKERGAGGGHIRFNMAKGSMNSHISQFPIGTYKKGHAHGPGAHVIILSGQGYSLMWPEGDEPRRYDWEVGTLIVPPNMWFHQHFNSGTTPGALSRLQARGGVHP